MEKRFLNAVDSSYAFVFGTILSQLGVFVFSMFAMFIASLFKLDSADVTGFFNGAVGYLITSLVLFACMFFVFLFFRVRSKEKIAEKPKVKKIFLYIFLACLAFFMLGPIVNCVDSLLTHWGFKLNTLTYPLTTPNYFISLLSICILPAIFEELLFRGTIFKGLKRNGKIFSIMISALMFSLGHMAISQTVYPLIMGMFFAVIMYYENNILYTIIAHMVCNFLSLTFSFFNISLMFNHWTYILLAVVLAVIFIGVLLFFVIKENKTNEKQPLANKEKIIITLCIVAMFVLWVVSAVSSKV